MMLQNVFDETSRYKKLYEKESAGNQRSRVNV